MPEVLVQDGAQLGALASLVLLGLLAQRGAEVGLGRRRLTNCSV